MIVTCERCTTQFQLDDARIPPGGVRVRCSRCKHAFEIALPTAEGPGSGGPLPGDTLPDLPPGAAPGDERWSGSEGLDGPALADEPVVSETSAFAGRSALSEPASSSFLDQDEESSLLDEGPGDEEESDWEFNEEPPAARTPESGDAANVVDQFLRSPRSIATGADATPYQALSARPSGLDLADDSSGLVPASDEPERDLPARRVRSPERAGRVPSGPARPPRPKLAAIEATVDELGAAEDWDLFGGESDGPSAARAPSVRLPAPVALDDDPIDRPRWAGWASRTAGLAGWVAVCGLFAFGVLGALTPATRAPLEVEAGTTGGLELVEASGVWIDNAVAGPIYVLSGSLRNAGSSEVAMPALAVELLDREGRMVADLPVPLETPHSRRNLRELAPAELTHGPPLEAGGPIAPGDSVPFQAVMGAVPRQAASYRVVDAPPSLHRNRPAAPGSERPGEPKRKRRDSAFEMIAGQAAESEEAKAEAPPEPPPASTPAALAP